VNHAIEIALPQPQSEHGGKSPLDWKWPAAPALMTLFDKYSGRESVVRLADRHWVSLQLAARYGWSSPRVKLANYSERLFC
jgi:hypothetical protein